MARSTWAYGFVRNTSVASVFNARCEINTPFRANGTGINTSNNCWSENVTPQDWVTRAVASSFHTGGVHGLMADGAVRFVNQSISSNPLPPSNANSRLACEGCTWQNLIFPSDGFVLGEF